MIKRITIFTLITFILFLTGYYLNRYFVDNASETLSFSLLNVYAFNAISCAIIYILVEIVSNYLPNETGYLYLGLVMVKLGLFILIFQEAIFSDTPLTKTEKASILLPFLVFLCLETIGASKLMNNK